MGSSSKGSLVEKQKLCEKRVEKRVEKKREEKRRGV
jgi:hypothetical protein